MWFPRRAIGGSSRRCAIAAGPWRNSELKQDGCILVFRRKGILMEDRVSLEHNTGRLFSDLWGPYDGKLFEESVDLFVKRLQKARFDPNWFKAKSCLDAGCGGGRNSVAMARLGAKEVVGIDVGEQGLT